MANFSGFLGKPKPSLPGRNHTEFSSGYYSQPYVSTWEDEDSDEENKELFRRWSRCVSINARAVRDMRNYRLMCREIDSDARDVNELRRLYKNGKIEAPNLRFYQNKMSSSPDDVFIDQFHKRWFRDYRKLEWVHSYIQWLFPIQEPGMNYEAHVLTPEEIKLFRADDEAKERLWCSYKLMLDFYGIELLDDKTGEVVRAENWEERFENLNSNTHNNLRITRILKCLGILGFEHYQAPLVKFFLHETLVEGTLRRVKQSVLDYFIFTVLDRSERKELIRFALEHIENEESRSNRNQGTFLRVTGSNKAQKSEPKCSESESDTQTQSEDESGSFHNNSDDVGADKNSEKTPSSLGLLPESVSTGTSNVSDHSNGNKSTDPSRESSRRGTADSHDGENYQSQGDNEADCTNSSGQANILHSPDRNNEEATNKLDNTSLIGKNQMFAEADKKSSSEDESDPMETTSQQ